MSCGVSTAMALVLTCLGFSAAVSQPRVHDTFAIIRRPAARFSLGVRECLTELEEHMHAVAQLSDSVRSDHQVHLTGSRCPARG